MNPRSPRPSRGTWSSAAACGAFAAAFAGPAVAQSSVTLYGSLDTAAYSKQLAGESRVQTVTSGILNASRWGIRGTEDLGDGLRARFDLSSYIRMDTGGAGRSDADGFWQRYAWVGLEDRWGLVRLGRISTPDFIQTIRFNPFADSSLSPIFMQSYLPSATQPLMTSHGVTDSAWSNSIAYGTPSIAGFEAALQGSLGEGTTAGRRVGASAGYFGPALSLGVSVEDMRHMSLSFSKPPASLPIERDRSAQVAAAYDFQAVKLYAQVQRTKLENTGLEIRLDTAQLGASVPIGLGKLLASVASTKKEQTALDDVRRTTVSIGYDYFLSKRTDVYAVAVSDKATALDRGNGLALGIRHNF